jgi:AN1-type zinc finger protein 1
MEFFDLGKHCHFCKQQDYLPFDCEFCKHSFCSDHRYATAHSCEKYTTKVQKKVEQKPTTVTKLNNCHHKRCQEFSITNCKQCNHSFCSNHRHVEHHECQKNENVNNSTSRVFDMTKIKDHSLRKAIESEVRGKKLREEFGFKRTVEIKQTPTTRKSNQSMSFSNTKETSFGNQNTEQEDRFYFKIFFPKESSLQPVHWFFENSRSVGKIIDLIAQKGKIKSKIYAPNDPSRLNIYKFSNGEPLKTSSTLKELEKEGFIKNGEVIILERGLLGETLNVNEKIFGMSTTNGNKDSFKQVSPKLQKDIVVYL